ncbi:MAG: hypothetical protein ACK4UN_09995 [Limisphaerales bacterium]
MNPFLRATFLLLCLASVISAREPNSKASLRGALIDFTSDDNSYRSKLAAENFTAALQAVLSGADSGVEWVERGELAKADEELSLQSFSFSTDIGGLRRGKWAKADLSVLGEFVRKPDGQRALHIEILDLNRADVLIDEQLPLKLKADQPLSGVMSELTEIGDKVGNLVARASKEYKLARQQKAIALLFLHHSGMDSALDVVEDEFTSLLQQKARESQQFRIIRFPRPSDASEESTIILGGLTDASLDNWANISDYYVWGDYRVQPEFIFDRETRTSRRATFYLFNLTIWDGKADPIVETQIGNEPWSGGECS